jgi:hypothetical protein
MSESVQITDPDEIAAVRNGEIIGYAYAGGECGAIGDDLVRWRASKGIAAPGPATAVIRDA